MTGADPQHPTVAMSEVAAAPLRLAQLAAAAASRFYLAMAVITLFALGNASDAFILLRLNDLGVAAGLDSAAVVRRCTSSR